MVFFPGTNKYAHIDQNSIVQNLKEKRMFLEKSSVYCIPFPYIYCSIHMQSNANIIVYICSSTLICTRTKMYARASHMRPLVISKRVIWIEISLLISRYFVKGNFLKNVLLKI